MDLNPIIDQVEQCFRRIDQRTAAFREQHQVCCPPECSTCCTYPRIHTTVLEFLPLGRFLWCTHQAEEVYRSLSAAHTACALYAPGRSASGGHCSTYEYRSLLCRLYGYTATETRSGIRTYVGCRTLHRLFPRTIASQPGSALEQLPTVREARRDLEQLAPELARTLRPINTAIRYAIEITYCLDRKSVVEH